MEQGTLSALATGVVAAPGGRCREQRPLLTVLVPSPTQPPHPNAKEHLQTALTYILTIFSERTRAQGFTVLVDARGAAWRAARAALRRVTQVLPCEQRALTLVLRPDHFWDKQRVDHCTKTNPDTQAVYIPRSRLNKYVDVYQLPEDLGGKYPYNHTHWIDNRVKVEGWVRDGRAALVELELLRAHLLRNRALRASDVERALHTSRDMAEATRMLVHSVTEMGKELLENIEYENRTRKLESDDDVVSTPQDTLDTIEAMETLLANIHNMKHVIDDAWQEMERSFGNAKDLSLLEEGVARVTNWILGSAEMILNSQQRVGFDVISAEELRREHEALELQCWNTYGQYAELLHKIDSFPPCDISLQQKDLISQRDFMDFVCRSFATRLERRRNILITSLRFFRLVAEYFDRTSEVFEALVMGSKIDDLSVAVHKLRELQENQLNLELVERELFKEGEKLSDMLSMPVKDALGRDVCVNYEEDIINIRDILDATTARKNIFSDSVELQKLTLEQMTHIDQYEKDVEQAITWINDLFYVMVREHGYVGCNVNEIQAQKEEHQAFQQTAKGTYNYGCQLLSASLSLRQSCRLPLGPHAALADRLKRAWSRLQCAVQEQLTRLRVSAVFHRSVDEHCGRLTELRDAVDAASPTDAAQKRAHVRHHMAQREKLLLEVGRMMRLGRLLRTRLREPLYDSMSDVGDADGEESQLNEGNLCAVEAISERLGEVTALAEQLDMALRGAHQDCALASHAALHTPLTHILEASTATTSTSTGTTANAATATDEWRPIPKLPRNGDEGPDDEYVTASECTYPQSRSSSFNTASECGHFSPWWEFDKTAELNEDVSKEKMVLAVGCPDLPAPKSVLKPSPEVPPGKVVHEVTETTHLKVQHCHTLGVSSFVLTSETVRDGKPESQTKTGQVREAVTTTETRQVLVPVAVERDVDENEFMKRMKEVGPPFEDKTAWSKYYHNYVTKYAIKSCT